MRIMFSYVSADEIYSEQSLHNPWEICGKIAGYQLVKQTIKKAKILICFVPSFYYQQGEVM